MNFSNMPELSWEYGYATVIALSLVIIAAELAFSSGRNGCEIGAPGGARRGRMRCAPGRCAAPDAGPSRPAREPS